MDPLREVMARHNVRAKKAFGQNFLGDPRILQGIAQLVGTERVLEIGPGLGTLTWFLAEHAKQVVAVEVDTTLLPVLADTLCDRPNATVVEGDILKVDADALMREKTGEGPYDVAANLPYYITTPVVMQLLEHSSAETVVVMVQKEVAQRMVAGPGSKAYGVLSLAVQYFTRADIAMQVPAGAFTPRPAVDSALVRMVRRSEPPVDVPREAFMKAVQAGFAMRRKTLCNNLMAGYGISRQRAEAAVAACGLKPDVRAEALTMAQFADLAKALAG